MAKKIIILIVMLILLAGSACGIYFGIQYYNIKDSAQYEDSTGTVELVNELRDKIVDLNTEIARLNNEILELTSSNNSKDEQISSLQESKKSLEQQVASLTETNNSNAEIISQNEQTISALEKQISALESTVEDNTNEIEQLNKSISSLRTLNSQLQKINDNNITTITNLNVQIVNLNNQVNDLLLQVSNNSNIVSSLNAKIQELEKSVAYYEEYIAGLETGTQVVATFEFDGSVYNIQIVNKNSIVTVTTPTSTDYVIFNYWTVNGEQVDLSSYQITTNTKFVANVTYKYDVKFMVDNEEYDGQIVVKNGFATLPEEPVKVGYEFDGWSLNGVAVVENVSTIAVTQNVTYQAVFTKLHTVTFMYEDEVKSTQQVRNGEYATDVEVENTTYKVFNGWKASGSFVDIESYKVNADTVFVADITYKYDVVFMVDNEEYDSQIIIENGYATFPANPIKDGYEFDGWSLNGVDVVENITTIPITQNVTYKAVFTKIHTVIFMCEDEAIFTQQIKNGNIVSSPEANNKLGYRFKGWSLNGKDVISLNEYQIFEDTIFYAKYSLWQDGSYGNGTLIIEDGKVKYLYLMETDCTSQCTQNSPISISSGKLPANSYLTLTFGYYDETWCWKVTGTVSGGVVDYGTEYLTLDNEINEVNLDGSYGNGSLIIENGEVKYLNLMETDCTSQCTQNSPISISSGKLPANSYLTLTFGYYNNTWCWKVTGTVSGGVSEYGPEYLTFDMIYQ